MRREQKTKERELDFGWPTGERVEPKEPREVRSIGTPEAAGGDSAGGRKPDGKLLARMLGTENMFLAGERVVRNLPRASGLLSGRGRRDGGERTGTVPHRALPENKIFAFSFFSSLWSDSIAYRKPCKKIGFIGYSDPVSTIRQRIQGYKSALLEADESTAPRVLYLKYIGGDYFPLIKQFILDENFDGFMCATSSLCNELVEVLDSLDEEVQNKLKIISFDDNPWLDYLKYPISVISQPVAEIGNAALKNLLQFIDQTGDNYNVKRELLFDTTIIDRTANYRQT
jgi:hypothetical protein